ncbi:MAG: hypothetical protein M1817_005334 [Caeruleum heppii]|nr:MAG: hypothetical protein M1817_005334 [Caeruleum heppii]
MSSYPSPPSTSLIYHNPLTHTTLIDLPLSLSLAQHLHPPSSSYSSILSTKPPEEPYVISNEPKKWDGGNVVEELLHTQIRQVVEEGLKEIRQECQRVRQGRNWCFERYVAPASLVEGSKRRKKRKREEDLNDLAVDDLVEPTISLPFQYSQTSNSTPFILSQPRTTFQVPASITHRTITNPTLQPRTISLSSPIPSSNPTSYTIPPKATTTLSPIQSSAFSLTLPKLLSTPTSTCPPSSFDLILLDPPWPNASARRSNAYGRPRNMRETKDLLLDLELERYLTEGGIVGVWGTNKWAVRECILGKTNVGRHGPGTEEAKDGTEKDDDGEDAEEEDHMGLFDHWNVTPLAEWIWLKVTIKGEPITDLNSRWRKPYEILYLGRKAASSPSPPSPFPPSPPSPPPRHLIISVPSFHSQKPHLRSLLELQFFSSPLAPACQTAGGDSDGQGQREPAIREYRALEIFARCATAGWWSWGDEALRFAWEGWWRGGSGGGEGDEEG